MVALIDRFDYSSVCPAPIVQDVQFVGVLCDVSSLGYVCRVDCITCAGTTLLLCSLIQLPLFADSIVQSVVLYLVVSAVKFVRVCVGVVTT